jgi:hypothetical protein
MASRSWYPNVPTGSRNYGNSGKSLQLLHEFSVKFAGFN